VGTGQLCVDIKPALDALGVFEVPILPRGALNSPKFVSVFH
jgi:hypothetical protein